jgi:hypothetical protein
MQSKSRWKKGFFSSVYNIHFKDQQIGTLKDKIFSQTSDGEIKGKKIYL